MPDIRQSTGSEDTVGDCVREAVGIRMSEKTLEKWNCDAPENERTIFDKPVYVVTGADAKTWRTAGVDPLGRFVVHRKKGIVKKIQEESKTALLENERCAFYMRTVDSSRSYT